MRTPSCFRPSLLAGLLACLGASAAAAMPPPDGALDDDMLPFASAHHVEPLDDDQLHGLRGRWSGPQTVVAMGLDIRSTWRTDEGHVLSASASLQVDAASLARRAPTVKTDASVELARTGSPSAQADGTRRISGGDPTLGVSGLGQSVQLAGDRNLAVNRFDVETQVADSRREQTNLAATSLPNSRATSSAGGASGPTASARASGGALTLELAVPGVGRVSQRLGAAGEAPGLKQSIRIAGDGQSVSNVATLRLTVAPVDMRSFIDAAVRQAITSQTGLRR